MTTAEYVKRLWCHYGRMPRTAIPVLIDYDPVSRSHTVTYGDKSRLLFRASDVLPGLTSLSELGFAALSHAGQGRPTGRVSYVYTQAILVYTPPQRADQSARLTLKDGRIIDIMPDEVLSQFPMDTVAQPAKEKEFA